MEITIHPQREVWTPFTLRVQPTDKIASVQIQIENERNIAPGDQRLLYQGKHLHPDQTLESYGINGNSILYLIRRNRL